MKYILLFLTLITSSSVFANDLCTNFKPEVKERRLESSYNLESYNKALKGLKEFSKESGIDPWPYMVTLEGFLLKQEALQNQSQSSLVVFCEFIVQQGVHRG